MRQNLTNIHEVDINSVEHFYVIGSTTKDGLIDGRSNVKLDIKTVSAGGGGGEGGGIDVSNIPEVLQPRFAYYYASGMHPTYVMVGFPDYTTDEYSQYFTYEYVHEGDEQKSYIFDADACNWEYSTIDDLEANFDSLMHPQKEPYMYVDGGMLVILFSEEVLSREEFVEGPVSTSLLVYYDSETGEYGTSGGFDVETYVRLNNQLFYAFAPYMD